MIGLLVCCMVILAGIFVVLCFIVNRIDKLIFKVELLEIQVSEREDVDDDYIDPDYVAPDPIPPGSSWGTIVSIYTKAYVERQKKRSERWKRLAKTFYADTGAKPESRPPSPSDFDPGTERGS